jgi:hypothetical protein
VFFENLLDEVLGGLGSNVPDQKIDGDYGKLFRTARAVRTVPVLPLGFDVGVDAYSGHDGTREVRDV